MGKIRTFDYFNNFRFHLLDVSFTLPPVFTFAFGFKYVSAPEIQIETRDFKEGAHEYRKSVIKEATVSEIELHQGARLGNSDFYDWVKRCIDGNSGVKGANSVRRNFMLIQYMDVHSAVVATAANAVLGAAAGASTGGLAGAGIGAVSSGSSLAFQSFTDVVQRVPGRAWMLMNCLPTRYKAATDFDALGSEISLMELTIKPQIVTELNTGIG